VPFHEIWRLSQSRAGMAADPRFEGAIVLIGSTASSLFDVKATPISSIHPGVHVLANAIDNVKNGHFLHEPPQSVKFITVWVCLLLMGLASARMKTQVLRWSVLVIPGVLLAVSFISLHVGDWFVDLSGPASHALLFFTAMSVYQNWRLNHFAQAQPMVESLRAQGQDSLLKAYVVMTYAEEKARPQRLITHAAASGSQVAVVQSGWYGEVIGDQSGPACVLLVGQSADALHASIQKLLAAEAPFVSRSDVSNIDVFSSHALFTTAQESNQTLWHALAKALAKWENHQN